MRRAVELSKRGYPAPNPHVGCVLVRGDEIVGEGYHRRAGQAHAEVNALLQAGTRAQGSTAYVTLEPCNHHGRTGPCSQALIAAGVKRVVYAVADPNPKAMGGHAALAQAGIQVESGLLAGEAEAANAIFLTAERRKSPYVCLKAAMSLDGRIALPSGESKWITGPDARREAHRLRAQLGAVLVGPGTVLADDPELTARFRGAPGVTRVVLDPRVELPASAKVFNGSTRTLHVVPVGCNGHADVLELPLENRRFDLSALMSALFDRGIRGLLVEGGSRTLASFLPLADRLELFVAGKVLGSGPAWVDGAIATELSLAPRFRLGTVHRLGEDLHITSWPTPCGAGQERA